MAPFSDIGSTSVFLLHCFIGCKCQLESSRRRIRTRTSRSLMPLSPHEAIKEPCPSYNWCRRNQSQGHRRRVNKTRHCDSKLLTRGAGSRSGYKSAGSSSCPATCYRLRRRHSKPVQSIVFSPQGPRLWFHVEEEIAGLDRLLTYRAFRFKNLLAILSTVSTERGIFLYRLEVCVRVSVWMSTCRENPLKSDQPVRKIQSTE